MKRTIIKKIKTATKILFKNGFSEFWYTINWFFKFHLKRIVFYPLIVQKLKKEVAKKHSVNEVVNLIFNGFHAVFAPAQIKFEITELCKILEQTNPKTVLEIGTATGGTLFLFSRFSASNATIVSIDLPYTEFDGYYAKVNTSLYKKFKSPMQTINLLSANSQQQETVELLKQILLDKPIDFLFIDADHSYEGVKKDYELYSPLVKKGGIIAFHDIVKNSKLTGWEGTYRFWSEIKVGKNYKEIIENPNQGRMGIGVIFT